MYCKVPLSRDPEKDAISYHESPPQKKKPMVMSMNQLCEFL